MNFPHHLTPDGELGSLSHLQCMNNDNLDRIRDLFGSEPEPHVLASDLKLQCNGITLQQAWDTIAEADAAKPLPSPVPDWPMALRTPRTAFSDF